MVLLGYDGASAFDLNSAKQHGGIVIADYLVGHPGGYDPANEARVDHTRFLGMGAYPNWERAAGFFNTCTVAEARAAGVEGAAATKALGFPVDGTIRIAFSFDQYVPGARFAEMGQKFDAVRAGIGAGFHAAVYGQYPLINYLVANGHAPGKHWLSGSTFNEPYNASGPNIAMVQSHDAQGNWINTQVPGTDVNTVIDPHALGAWWPAGSPYASTTTASGEASMIYIKAPTGGIGVMAGGGKYHFTPAEWTAHSAVRNALPAAVRDSAAPLVSISDAAWNALPEYRDDLAQLTNAISAADTDLGARIAAAKVDVAALAAALAPLLSTTGTVTQAMLEQALRTVLGSVDNPGVTP